MEKWECCINSEIKANGQPADETNSQGKLPASYVFFIFYGKIALRPISYAAKTAYSKDAHGETP